MLPEISAKEELGGHLIARDLLHTPANIRDAAVALLSGSAGTTHALDVLREKLPLQRVHYYTFNAVLLPR